MAAIRPRGVSEKTVYAYNPLPDVSEAEIVEHVGLDLITPSTVPPFQFNWQYGGGLEKELVTINPGEAVPLRTSEAKELMREARDMGIVLLDDPHDEAEVRKKSIEGLHRARQYWRARGELRKSWYRKERGLSRDELEDMKENLHVWFINEGKVHFISEEARRLQGRGAPKKKNEAQPQEEDVSGASA